jgi:hypothetical protein
MLPSNPCLAFQSVATLRTYVCMYLGSIAAHGCSQFFLLTAGANPTIANYNATSSLHSAFWKQKISLSVKNALAYYIGTKLALYVVVNSKVVRLAPEVAHHKSDFCRRKKPCCVQSYVLMLSLNVALRQSDPMMLWKESPKIDIARKIFGQN